MAIQHQSSPQTPPQKRLIKASANDLKDAIQSVTEDPKRNKGLLNLSARLFEHETFEEGLDLAGFHFAECEFVDCFFPRVNLSGCVFEKSSMTQCSLQKANLSKALFEKCVLTSVNFYEL